MPYVITIIKRETVIKKAGGDWKVVSQAYPSEEDLAMLFAGRERAAVQPKDVYGYTPEIEKEVAVETKVFEQTVDELDLIGVIAAVNDMEHPHGVR